MGRERWRSARHRLSRQRPASCLLLLPDPLSYTDALIRNFRAPPHVWCGRAAIGQCGSAGAARGGAFIEAAGVGYRRHHRQRDRLATSFLLDKLVVTTHRRMRFTLARLAADTRIERAPTSHLASRYPLSFSRLRVATGGWLRAP